MKRLAQLLFLAPLVLAACAGTPIDWSKARGVTPGMTEQQLTDHMGAPYMVTARGADQVWVYSYADAFSGAKSVSFVMQNGKVIGVPTIPESFK
jgi:outer membrane protein assembly factor BamE (lipoprotein component of BamABCDE complex)